VVYNQGKAGHALDAKTGRHLWSSKPGPWLLQPLTDEFLGSQGRKGAVGGYCVDPVWVNGVYYSQLGCTSKVLWARGSDGKELWRFVPTSSACPTAAPAYGRLYYCAWGEGVVYCFVNQDGPAPAQGGAR
jgi:outer membrane protein assembly factor BamB